MDEEAVRAALEDYIRYSGAGDEDRASEIYHEDAVLEFPQSGERFEGVANFREWRRSYPAKVELEVLRLRGRDDFWVVEVRGRYDGGPWNHGPAIYEFRGDKVSRETIYVGEAWEPPDWRPGGEPRRPPEPGSSCRPDRSGQRAQPSPAALIERRYLRGLRRPPSSGDTAAHVCSAPSRAPRPGRSGGRRSPRRGHGRGRTNC